MASIALRGRRCSPNWLHRVRRGKGSDYIGHLTKRPDKPVVLYCRVSTRQQRSTGNLDEKVEEALQQLRELGANVIAVVAGVETCDVGAGRPHLWRAVQTARINDAVVVAPSRCRFLRWSEYTVGVRKEFESPKLDEYEELLRFAFGVPLATLLHPDQDARSPQTIRGRRKKKERRCQQQRGPYRRYSAVERQALTLQAIYLRQSGRSWRQIESELGVPQKTIRDWIEAVCEISDPPSDDASLAVNF